MSPLDIIHLLFSLQVISDQLSGLVNLNKSPKAEILHLAYKPLGKCRGSSAVSERKGINKSFDKKGGEKRSYGSPRFRQAHLSQISSDLQCYFCHLQIFPLYVEPEVEQF